LCVQLSEAKKLTQQHATSQRHQQGCQRRCLCAVQKAQHGSLHHSPAQHGSLHDSAAQHGSLLDSAAQHGSLNDSAAQHGSLHDSAAQHGRPVAWSAHLELMQSGKKGVTVCLGDRPARVVCLLPPLKGLSSQLIHPGKLVAAGMCSQNKLGPPRTPTGLH